ELIALGLGHLPRRAPLQKRCANARHREPCGSHSLRRSDQLAARQLQDIAAVDNAQINRTDPLRAGEGEPLLERRRYFVGDEAKPQICTTHGLLRPRDQPSTQTPRLELANLTTSPSGIEVLSTRPSSGSSSPLRWRAPVDVAC